MPDEVPLIFNPHAGGGRGARVVDHARTLLAEHGVTIDAVPTTEVDGARDMAARLVGQGHKRLLVLGGDGTLSEAVDGALKAGASPVFGFLPAGRGNDFLRSFGVLTMPEAVDRVVQGATRAIDVVRYEHPTGTGHSINIFGTGYVAHVGDVANRKYKWLGPRAYTVAAVRELVRLQAPTVRLTLDGITVEDEFALVAVCNTMYTGGAMKIAPFAEPDDGAADVVAVRNVGRAGLVRLLTQVFDGRHVGDDRVMYERAARVRIEPARPSPLLVDGEILGTTPVSLEVLPAAIEILV